MDLKDVQSKDLQSMISVLKDMGIDEYEPKVLNQLLEFSYKYVTNILEDARLLSSHANKKQIDAEDIKTALKSKTDYSFTTAPPRELLIELSQSKNKNPLPQIKYHPGIRLPPDRFCLHSTNYILKSKSTLQSSSSSSAQQQQPLFNRTTTNTQQTSFISNNNTSTSFTTQSQINNFNSIKRRRDDDDYDA